LEEVARREMEERVKEEAARQLSQLTPFAGVETSTESVKTRGVKVRQVKVPGPCASAGITTEESIVAIQGVYIDSNARFEEQISKYTPGDSVEFELHNDLDGLYKATVELGATELGAQEMVRDLRQKAGVPDTERVWGHVLDPSQLKTGSQPGRMGAEGDPGFLCPYRHVLKCETAGKSNKPQCTMCYAKIRPHGLFYDCVCTTACETCAKKLKR
jgi:hypothetical protein